MAMPAPNPMRQKKAWESIDRLFSNAENVWVIHYSCESFYDRLEGRSPRITSIAIRKLDDAQTISFSIHQVAEQLGVPFNEISQHYDQLERQMLNAYFAHLSSHRTAKYLHWNMRDINYGFAAIEHRYQVLKGEISIAISDNQKYDLARLLIDIYGVEYIGHHRLERLMEKNGISPRDFLNGLQEAEAFEKRNFVGLHQSTLRKVDVIANIAGRVHDRVLRTNTSWWKMHGGRVRTFVNWLADLKFLQLGATIGGVGALIYSIWEWGWPLLSHLTAYF
jgi:hypothetical protein